MARAIVVKKASDKAAGKPVASPVAKVKSKARKPSKRTAAQVGKSSSAWRLQKPLQLLRFQKCNLPLFLLAKLHLFSRDGLDIAFGQVFEKRP